MKKNKVIINNKDLKPLVEKFEDRYNSFTPYGKAILIKDLKLALRHFVLVNESMFKGYVREQLQECENKRTQELFDHMNKRKQ